MSTDKVLKSEEAKHLLPTRATVLPQTSPSSRAKRPARHVTPPLVAPRSRSFSKSEEANRQTSTPQRLLPQTSPSSRAKRQAPHVAQFPRAPRSRSFPKSEEAIVVVPTHHHPPLQTSLAPTISTIIELYRRRQDFLNAEGTLSRQIKAIERRMKLQNFTGGTALVVAQLKEARKPIHKHKMESEKALTKLAQSLPVYASFVEPINGFGAVGLGMIVGEAGDLAAYANPAKLWKRFGLGLVDGIRQQRRTNVTEAAAHGYSPRRRSVMFVLVDSLLKKKSAYKDLYNTRKAFEIEKAQAVGLIVRAAKKGDPRDQTAAGFRSKMVIHRRAQRYVEKRLLRNLWRAWRDQGRFDTPSLNVAPSSP